MKASVDVIVIGAGAAGMMAAAQIGQKGYQVMLIDHAEKLGEKIRISGGGRCNFTNIGATWQNYLSANPEFCRSALAQYGPQDFLELLQRHGVNWHEKHRGQLFCNDSSQSIIDVLYRECQQAGVLWQMPCEVYEIEKKTDYFQLKTSSGFVQTGKLIIATGGMAAPAIGATGFGLQVAKQFGHHLVDTRPALVPLVFDYEQWKPWSELSGISIPVRVKTHYQTKGRWQPIAFDEDILFTHRGLSGPGILQISSYWQVGKEIEIDLCPQQDGNEALFQDNGKQQLDTTLSQMLPRRLVTTFVESLSIDAQRKIAEIKKIDLNRIHQILHHWQMAPSGTAGYKKAEVMSGGVDTKELQQSTLESKLVSGLYFIGEVVDVTGWLGGYNFQWAWSSAMACARSI